MNLKEFRFLRTFLFLLLSVFLTDTVYAGRMMTADQLPSNHTSVSEHSIKKFKAETHSDHHKHEQSSSDQCSKCSHCMACLTVLPPSYLVSMKSQVLANNVTLIESSYHSHVSAQPQRPPIF